MLDLEQASYKWLWDFCCHLTWGSPRSIKVMRTPARRVEGFSETWNPLVTLWECGCPHLSRMPAGRPTTLNRKRKPCSFSRQLVIQTSQTLYKQGWLISATADMYTMWPASSSVTLDPWPWNNGIVFFITPCLMRPHWGKVAVLSTSQP